MDQGIQRKEGAHAGAPLSPQSVISSEPCDERSCFGCCAKGQASGLTRQNSSPCRSHQLGTPQIDGGTDRVPDQLSRRRPDSLCIVAVTQI